MIILYSGKFTVFSSFKHPIKIFNKICVNTYVKYIRKSKESYCNFFLIHKSVKVRKDGVDHTGYRSGTKGNRLL